MERLLKEQLDHERSGNRDKETRLDQMARMHAEAIERLNSEHIAHTERLADSHAAVMGAPPPPPPGRGDGIADILAAVQRQTQIHQAQTEKAAKRESALMEARHKQELQQLQNQMTAMGGQYQGAVQQLQGQVSAMGSHYQ